MIVYDITSRDSFIDIDKQMKGVKEYSPKYSVKILIGNKCDEKAKREVTYEEGEEMASKYGMPFLETSAKTGHNVEKAFMLLLIKTMNRVEFAPIPVSLRKDQKEIKRAVFKPAKQSLLSRCICF